MPLAKLLSPPTLPLLQPMPLLRLPKPLLRPKPPSKRIFFGVRLALPGDEKPGEVLSLTGLFCSGKRARDDCKPARR